LLQAFIKLVALPKSRCLASELLEILETPTVLRRFAIENDEFVQIQQWVKDTGIRWGLNRQTQRQFSLPEVSQHTWEFGLQRILAGYALGEDIQIFDTGEQHIAPYNEIQGSTVELAGKMALFIDSVRLHREQLSLAQDIDQWRTSLLTLLDDFFLVESEDEIVMTHIRQWIDDLADEVAVGGVSDEIDADIISHHLQSRFGQASVSQRFLAGQLNFCTLMPMRSIPFKTVCLLGMNDGTFPRHRPREAFDLMSHAKVRPGDRSRRDDDRYLFLEALLSAQDSFYISYIGASIQDNSELMPSLLVSELQEYCQDNYMLNEDGLELIEHLTYMHPMTPYHPDNFVPPHASFASEWIGLQGETVEQSLSHTPSATVETRIESASIELSDLLRFWRLPVAYYFNRELKVFFEQATLATDDDEPFALDGLEHFKTRQFLLNEMLGQAFSEDKGHWQRYWLNVLTARGQLPVGPFGEMAYDLIFSQADSLFEASAAIRQQPLPPLEVSAVLHPWQDERAVSVTGWLDGQFAAGMLRLHCGRLSAKVLISAWLEHLFASLAGGQNSTHIFGFSKKNGLESHCFSPLQPEQAEFLLAPWLRLFVEGTNKPLAFFPETALRGVEVCYQENGFAWDEEVMHAAMKKVFESTDFSQGEDANPYVQRIWSAWDEELARSVSEPAKLLLSDLIEAMTKRDE
jgi:exodeoxyribonuclease V gamma subunit